MEKLYEKFILEYYRRHHTYLKIKAGKIKWNLTGDHSDSVIRFLPVMQTDIMGLHVSDERKSHRSQNSRSEQRISADRGAAG